MACIVYEIVKRDRLIGHWPGSYIFFGPGNEPCEMWEEFSEKREVSSEGCDGIDFE